MASGYPGAKDQGECLLLFFICSNNKNTQQNKNSYDSYRSFTIENDKFLIFAKFTVIIINIIITAIDNTVITVPFASHKFFILDTSGLLKKITNADRMDITLSQDWSATLYVADKKHRSSIPPGRRPGCRPAPGWCGGTGW